MRVEGSLGEQMEKRKVVVGDPVRVGRTTLIPLAEVSLNWGFIGRRGTWFLGSKQPTAVVLISPRWTKAFRVTGEEVPLSELVRQAPGIREVFDAVQHHGCQQT